MNSNKKQEPSPREALFMLALILLFTCGSCSYVYRGMGKIINGANESHKSQSFSNVDAGAVPDGSLSDLDKLTVNNDPTPPEKYNRVEQFGPAWKDVDHNGCDTRNDILLRDLSTSLVAGRNSCVVIAGKLADPYSGKWIDFRKEEASKVQIDHVVSLENAWQSGAYNLSKETREALANDPDNLLAVNGHDNMVKGSKSADQWMPPNSTYACAYASKQVQIKTRYTLTVTTPEKQALADALATCTTD